jgi:hypothetical protein
MKVLLNVEYGGFRIPDAIATIVAIRKGVDHIDPWGKNVERHDPILIATIEEAMNKEWDEETAAKLEELQIVEIVGDKYWICEYDGVETIYTPETIPWTIVK